MTEITEILEAEKHLDGVEAVIFDLDDTLYSEKEYVKSGYHQIAKRFGTDYENRLWQAFLEKKPAIDAVIPEHKAEALNIYRNQIPDIHLYAGVIDMLIRLGNKYRLGIITDGRPEGQKAKIQSLGIEKLFNKIIITDELGGAEYRKPCPVAFEKMLEALNVVPERAVYIGDNISKDFKAPEALGMQTIWFKNRDGLYSDGGKAHPRSSQGSEQGLIEMA